MSIASAIYPKLAYHPTKSFVPLTMIANFPLILAIPADHPAKTVQELVAWMKANPDKSNYATSSPAFTIATELFKLKTGAPGAGDPLQEQRRVAGRGDGRADVADDRRRAAGRAAGEGRQGACARGDGFGAFRRTARRAEHGGGRIARA